MNFVQRAVKVYSKLVLVILLFVVAPVIYHIGYSNLTVSTAPRKQTSVDASVLSVTERIAVSMSHRYTTKDTLDFYRKMIKCNDITVTPRQSVRGNNWVLYNYIPAERQFKCYESVTFTTMCDHTFLDCIVPVVTRWQGPVSVAIFTPGDDYQTAIETIAFYRNCIEESFLIRQLVTFSLIFPTGHMPTSSILSGDDASNFKANCTMVRPHESDPTYRKQKKILYPINVLRNVAIETSTTHWIFPADIELFPSIGVIPDFMEMVTKAQDPAFERPNPRVFVLPPFEIEEGYPVPENKTELQKLLSTKKAIPFHDKVCHICHTYPKAKEWREAEQTDGLHVFHIAKRLGGQKSWEPFFIAARDVPLFDDRMSWEGKFNKMLMGFKLCLLDYDFMILDNAFVMHRPGIKTPQTNHRPKYANIASQYTNIRHAFKDETVSIYGSRVGCCVCDSISANCCIVEKNEPLSSNSSDTADVAKAKPYQTDIVM